STDFHQLLPFPTVPCKARHFPGCDRTHVPQAYFGNHAFEAHSGHGARCGAAEILFDHFDVAPAQAAQSIPHGILQFLTLQVVLNLIRRGLAHVQDRLSFDMVRLDLVTHRGPPLRFRPLPPWLDAVSVTAPAIARSFVEHRTPDSSNAGCIADEPTTGVGSISAGPSILPSAPPACSKYRGCVLGTIGARTRGRAACKPSLRARRDCALAEAGLDARILQQAATSNIQSGTSKTRQAGTSSKLQCATAWPRFTRLACTRTARP